MASYPKVRSMLRDSGENTEFMPPAISEEDTITAFKPIIPESGPSEKVRPVERSKVNRPIPMESVSAPSTPVPASVDPPKPQKKSEPKPPVDKEVSKIESPSGSRLKPTETPSPPPEKPKAEPVRENALERSVFDQIVLHPEETSPKKKEKEENDPFASKTEPSKPEPTKTTEKSPEKKNDSPTNDETFGLPSVFPLGASEDSISPTPKSKASNDSENAFRPILPPASTNSSRGFRQEAHRNQTSTPSPTAPAVKQVPNVAATPPSPAPEQKTPVRYAAPFEGVPSAPVAIPLPALPPRPIDAALERPIMFD